MVDLVQVVADHERVVGGELAVQGLDESRDLVSGFASGQVRQTPGIALAGDESLQDGASGGADDVALTDHFRMSSLVGLGSWVWSRQSSVGVG
ncbi:hypothetical protein ACFV3E_44695 [Streptomyces sp. NPDC059718]